MRFIKNPKVSLEKKPSWADEMSIFNSFYNLKGDLNHAGSLNKEVNGDKFSEKDGRSDKMSV